MNVYFHSDKLAGASNTGANNVPSKSGRAENRSPDNVTSENGAKNDGERDLNERIIDALRQIYDPEIPVNIYDLGLIYDIRISDTDTVEVDMTLTAPGCPVAHTFPGLVENAVREVEGVCEAHVDLIWEPAWNQDRISDEAKLALGIL
jgi:FeS assembly SUF system protein